MSYKAISACPIPGVGTFANNPSTTSAPPESGYDRSIGTMISATEILNARILVVDDQVIGARALAAMLREAGYNNVTHTTDPYQVCALHRAHRYTLILLDMEMPGKNGFQVMLELNAVEAEGYAPVLAITAEPSYKVHAHGMGQALIAL